MSKAEVTSKGVFVGLWMPPTLRQRLKVEAARSGKTVQNIVNGLLEGYLKKREAKA